MHHEKTPLTGGVRASYYYLHSLVSSPNGPAGFPVCPTKKGNPMTDVAIPAIDLQALLDVAEGYTAENGLDAVQRYAIPKAVQRAIHNGKAALTPNGREVQLPPATSR